MMFEVFVTIVVIILSAWFYNFYYYYRHIKTIPGPRVWPIVGNMLVFREFNKSLHTFTFWLKKLNTKTLRIHTPYSTALYTMDYKLIEHILTSSSNINKGYHYSFFSSWLGSGLFTVSGQQWRKQRKMITPTFHFHILEQYVEVFNSNAAILVSCFAREVGQQSVDVTHFISLCTLDSICETAMGTKINAQLHETSEYVQAVHTMTNLVAERATSPLAQFDALYKFTALYEKEERALKVLHGQTESVIQSRQNQILKQGGNSEYLQQEDDLGRKKRVPFLDMLLQATIDGKPLTDRQIRDEVSTFMFGGHDTISTAISFALYALANHPECQQKVFDELYQILGDDAERACTYQELQEMKYLDIVIKETLRLYPPAPYFSRVITEEFQFDGVTYPKHLTIGISTYHIHQDAEHFPDPEKFDPERFSRERYNGTKPFSFVPFSAGARNCIGQKFAFVELKAILSIVLRKFILKPATPVHKLQLSASTILMSLNGINISLENRVY